MSVATSDILNAKRRRLRKLELRAAQAGYATPPEVDTEIDDLRVAITEASAPTSDAERFTILFGLLSETRTDVRHLWLLMIILMPILMLLLSGFMVVLVRP
jgi:hypothetical protein